MTTPNGGFDLSNVDMNGLLAQAQAMQAQLAQAQQQLESTTFDGSAADSSKPSSPVPENSPGSRSTRRPSIPTTPTPWPTWSLLPSMTPVARLRQPSRP